MSPKSVHRATLVAVLALAAATRLAYLDEAPPGLHHDEASNGYDAYSILKTGCDRWGHPWPIVLEAFGRCDHRTALYAYLIVPFHAILGAENLTVATRLPAAFFGILTIACFYALVARTHGRGTGLWAALFLTLSPWHLQLSRFGHESTLTAGITALALLSVSMARRTSKGPGDDDGALRPVPLVLGGVLFALSLYTYASMRLFTPLLLLAAAWIYRAEFGTALRHRASRRAIALAITASALVAVPLVVLSATRWDIVMARAEQVSLFHRSASVATALFQSAAQYADHFSPRWLFTQGDRYAIQSPPGYGQLSIAIAPLLLIGLYATIRDRRRNRAGMLVLAWLLLHPLAASMSDAGPHALRSACGLPAFQWLAAIGAGAAASHAAMTAGRRRLVAAICLAAVAINGSVVVRDYFGRWSRDPWVAALYQRDLRDAMRAIRPIFGNYDRIYISDQVDRDRRWYSGEAYAIALIALPVEPATFQQWDKVVVVDEPSGFHRVASMGPFVMTTRSDVLRQSFEHTPRQRALFVARPGEINGFRRIHTVESLYHMPRFEIFATP